VRGNIVLLAMVSKKADGKQKDLIAGTLFQSGGSERGREIG
jgi:hypothetical protein